MIFFVRSGTCVTGRSEGNVGLQPRPHAACHLLGDLGAYCALFL